MNFLMNEWFSLLGISTAFFLLAIYLLSILKEIRIAKKETSRFPLFAARDHLVELVMDQKMSEDDRVWQGLYGAVNTLLGMNQSLHVLDIIWQYRRYQNELSRNPQLRDRVKKLMVEINAAKRRVPQFSRVDEEVISALKYLIDRRTTMLHQFILLLLYLVISGYQITKATAKFINSPSTEDVVGWSSSISCKYAS